MTPQGSNHVSDRLNRARQFATNRRRISALPHRSAVTKLRFAFFALASDAAVRYGVRFERVLHHLWEGRRFNRRFLVRSIMHMDELVHAVACVDNIGLAWADLAENYERALVRRCRGEQDDCGARADPVLHRNKPGGENPPIDP